MKTRWNRTWVSRNAFAQAHEKKTLSLKKKIECKIDDKKVL